VESVLLLNCNKDLIIHFVKLSVNRLHIIMEHTPRRFGYHKIAAALMFQKHISCVTFCTPESGFPCHGLANLLKVNNEVIICISNTLLGDGILIPHTDIQTTNDQHVWFYDKVTQFVINAITNTLSTGFTDVFRFKLKHEVQR
jgi:hypothetical protein